MSNLKLSIEPGFYLEPQSATWEVGGDISYVVFNQGGAPPAISEYIAYDTLSPPNPFIAVTQDGRGNVVYDGGFPKLYNGNAPAANATFAQLSATMKFVYNALRWIANPVKLAAGNNKILVLGDSTVDYRINGTGPNDFLNTLTNIIGIAGFVPTFRRSDSYSGGLLDCRLAELDQYCAVFLMSSRNGTGASAAITNAAVADIGTFRSQGNGLFIMTDHGPIINDIADATSFTTAGFFALANKVAAQFGSYFSGDYNRSPVNVGYLRNNYGDHPLYAGMANSESIYAGGSESRVVVAEYTKYAPNNLPPVQIANSGQNLVQAAALLNDGSVETYRGFFVIAEGDVIKFVDGQGRPLTSVNVGIMDRLVDLEFTTNLQGAGTVLGDIRRNNDRIGSFVYTDDLGTAIVWFAGSSELVKVNNGDQITVQINQPFSYAVSLPINRWQPDIVEDVSLTEIFSKLQNGGRLKFEGVVNNILSQIRVAGYPVFKNRTVTADGVGDLKHYFERSYNGSDLPPLKMPIFATDAAAEAGLVAYKPPTQADIFTSWGRTQGREYYPPGSSFPSEAAAWTWDNTNQRVVQPLNTNSYVSFVSPEKKDAYVLDVVLRSTDGDDDDIGLLLAMPVVNPAERGSFDGLYARVLRSPRLGGNSFIISVGDGSTNVLSNNYIPTQSTDNGGDGWSGKTRRMKVTRKGDWFRVETSDWNSPDLLPDATIEFSLEDRPEFATFRGAQHFGLMSFSQPASTYSRLNIVDGSVRSAALVVSGAGLYQYALGRWSKVAGVNFSKVYGTGRIIENTLNNQRYRVATSGQLIAI